jgi:hypothetical protein
MKNTILAVSFFLLTIVSHSQVVTVSTKGLQVYFRPNNMTLQECQEKNLVDHRYFGNGDCKYIFDLDKKVFTMKPLYTDWVFTCKITELKKNGNELNVTTELGTKYMITDKTDTNEKIFLIEYFDLPSQVEGRFAKEEDFSVSIK